MSNYGCVIKLTTECTAIMVVSSHLGNKFGRWQIVSGQIIRLDCSSMNGMRSTRLHGETSQLGVSDRMLGNDWTASTRDVFIYVELRSKGTAWSVKRVASI